MMMTEDRIQARADRLRTALKDAYGVRARTLDAALRRSGRRLPRGVKDEAQRVVEAQRLGGHPKLLRRVDPAALDRAEARVVEYLSTVDRGLARRRYWIGTGSVIAFNLLVVIAGLLVWWHFQA